MNDDNTIHNSANESDHSRSSEIALIGNLFSKAESLSSRDRKYSRKYNVTKDHIEEERNSFKWIPDQNEVTDKLNKRNQRKPSHTHTDQTMCTLDSDKTSSSCTASDFTSNVYTKNGYIRGTSDRKNAHDANFMSKHNEFRSLLSSLGTGRNFPVEIKPNDKEANTEQKRSCLKEEYSIYLILGGIQMMLGILMAVFGVLVIAHDSSLSTSGSGLWGGAVAMFSGLSGILAGFKGCYAHNKSVNGYRTLLIIFLALCLVSFALSNLVVVLTVTGLIRDLQKPKNQQEENLLDWPSVLSDVGLVLAAALQCTAAVFSGYKCYKQVCPCLSSTHSKLSDAVSQNEKYKAESKERLVNHWLGQQFRISNKKNVPYEGPNNLMPWGTPNIVLLPPPPPVITNGQIPILTFLQAPSSVFTSPPMYADSVPCCCRHDSHYMTSPHSMVHEKKSRRMNYIQPDRVIGEPRKPRSKSKKRERRASLPTAEEVARTYTGLDREMAEEFIAIAMDKGKKSRRNSLVDFTSNY